MRSVDDASFEREVIRAEGPVIVDFTAPWCGPCAAIAPALEELARESGVELVSLDVDENPETATRYGVLSLPTVMLFAEGAPRETVYGARPKKHFARAFAGYLPR
jgi:thioredoxin 1